MDFAHDETTTRLLGEVGAFMDEFVYPAERDWTRHLAEATDPFAGPPVLEKLKAEARSRGLWNLFLPEHPDGAGLTNLQYAPLAELMGRSTKLAPESMNCSAPDTGNMEILAMFGTAEQQERWLRPLLDGEIRSAFSMTEPDVASSDATNIGTRIERDGDHYVVNGTKWWSSGALNPRCALLVVMGKTDPAAPRHRQQSMLLVPKDTPGVRIVRPLTIFGNDDGYRGGHAEIRFEDARVPVENIVAGEGEGFAIAQARLGPGRIHHAMRCVGVAERALEYLCRRAVSREVRGGRLDRQGLVQDWIAEARVRIEQLRLLTLKTAWLMDTVGNKGAHTEIQAIKIVAPVATEWILDKAIQVHGAAGVSADFPLAAMWTSTRGLRIADGPDEVHRASLARRELKPYREAAGVSA
jgi:acyl-CoA dehydrogenase